MEMTIAQRLKTYINAELGDSALYKELAKCAPNEEYRKLLLEFAEDELSHAVDFMCILKQMTCEKYDPQINPPVLKDSFNNILRDRVLDESGDFRKYGEQFIQTQCNIPLRNAYYRARTDENVHALRLLYMLSNADNQFYK